MQTSSGSRIWTQGLPKLGIRPQAYELGFGLVPGIDPYNSPDDDVRWIFDATRKISHKTFGPGSLSTSKKDNDDDLTVEKGSIAINGTSLTVVDSEKGFFSVCIIPYTFEHTNFKDLKIGDHVNLEFDILGKYVAKWMSLK